MTQTIKADLCVIGAGSGGLSVAAGAAMLGRKVVLIEKGEMGGDCLNTGCVPSKALIAAAARAQAMRETAPFGIRPAAPEVDFPAVMDHVREVIASIAPMDSQERFEGLGVTVLRAHARFTGPRSVSAGDATVSARHFVIATGSTPAVPPIPGLESVDFMTNETLFDNRELPAHLIIIGGGPIGAEMAQAHRRLGARVSIIDAAAFLGREDRELADVVRRRLEHEGVEIIEGAEVLGVERTGAGVGVKLADRFLAGSHLLVAAGRRPCVGDLNLEAAGVAYSAKGVRTDARLRTTNRRIYAMGDVAGGRQFTHVAGYHASVIVRNILFKTPTRNRDWLAPRVTYCEPELAQVGLTEREAREQYGEATRVARWPFGKNDRAEAERDTDGLVKIVTDRKGRILGAGIAGRGAGDLIQPWTLAMTKKLPLRAFTDMIAPYPTRSEANKRAASDWYGPLLFSGRTRALIRLLALFD